MLGLLCLGVTVARADGDSGEALSSPDNRPAATKLWSGATGDWENAGELRCYARQAGVGLRHNKEGRQSLLMRTLDPAEPIACVVVTCSVATASHADKNLVLGLALEEGEPIQTRTMDFAGKTGTAQRYTFRFPERPTAEALIFSNETEDSIFEVERVEWFAEPIPLKITLGVSETIAAATPFACAISSVHGGSEVLASAVFTFNNESRTVAAPAIGETLAIPFVAPTTEGEYTLVVEATDSEGNTARAERTIQVASRVAPYDLQAGAITRTGFELTWEVGPLSLLEQVIAIERDQPTAVTPAPIAPVWSGSEEAGIWQLKSPIDLMQWTLGDPAKLILMRPENWSGGVEVRARADASWTSAEWTLDLAEVKIAAGTGQILDLRLTGEGTPPTTLEFALSIDRTLREVTKPADGLRNVMSLEGFEPGTRLRVTVRAKYSADTGSGALTLASEPLVVALQAVPPFTNPKVTNSALTFQWPEGIESPTGDIRLYGEAYATGARPAGLYLTHTAFATKDGGFEGNGKGLILTNTSDQPIALDGTYTLHSIKPDGSTKKDWNFSLAGEFPYVVPAHGSCVFSYKTYPLPEEREDTIQTTAGVVHSIAGATFTLMRGETVINSLPYQKDAICILDESAGEDFATAALTAAVGLEAFYAPWGPQLTETLIATYPLDPGSSTFYYPLVLGSQTEGYSRIRAELRAYDQGVSSAPLEVILRDRAVRKPGYRLILR